MLVFQLSSIFEYHIQSFFILKKSLDSFTIYTPPKTNSSHLNMGAPWKFGDSYEKPSLLGSVLVFGGVLVSIILKLVFCGPIISKSFFDA